MLVTRRKYFYLIYLIAILLVLPKIGLLNRFPWADLLYADFQIYNKWVWFSESFRSVGFLDLIFQSIDFRMNTGENIFLSSRTSSPIFDVGAWLYLLTNSVDLSIAGKFCIYSFMVFKGLLILIESFARADIKYSKKTHLFFTIALLSIITHPMFLHEIGPMALWYLMLTPYWIYFFTISYLYGLRKVLSRASFYLLLLLTLGSSDLFVLFYFSNFMFVFLFLVKNNKQKIKSVFYLFFIVEFCIILNKLPYLIFSLSDNYVSHSGSWSLNQYLGQFIFPLLTNSILIPDFTGPTTLFLNLIIILMIVILIMHSHFTRLIVKIMILNLIYLITIGVFLHSVPIFRENLPSAFRYHLAFWPIFVIIAVSLTMIYIQKFQSLDKKSVPMAAMMIVLLVNTETIYSQVTTNPSKRILDDRIREYTLIELPKCINDILDRSKFISSNRSVIFVQDQMGVDLPDLLNILIDNPSGLTGRTFNQWRYSTTVANSRLAESYGISTFFTRPFSSTNTENIQGFARKTLSPIVISNTNLEPNFRKLGSCVQDQTLKGRFTPYKDPTLLDRLRVTNPILGNASFIGEIFVHFVPLNLEDENLTPELEYRAGYVSVRVPCSFKNKITIPINESESLFDLKNRKYIVNQITDENFISLDMQLVKCNSSGEKVILISSRSTFLILDFILFITLILLVFLNIKNKHLIQL
jgi:hypothetical protein